MFPEMTLKLYFMKCLERKISVYPSLNKYMVASTQITNTETYAFIAALVFKLLSRKVLFIKRKNNRD